MSDVKKFTGFLAIDGSTHTSQKSAVEHSRQVKIKASLKEKFGALVVNDAPDLQTGDEPIALDDFILINRDAILSALNQEVLTRKKRTPKAPKTPKADADTAVAA